MYLYMILYQIPTLIDVHTLQSSVVLFSSAVFWHSGPQFAINNITFLIDVNFST